jgi:hypothetical protein
MKRRRVTDDCRLTVLAIGMGPLNELLELRVSSDGAQVVCGDLAAAVPATEVSELRVERALELIEAEFAGGFIVRRRFRAIDTTVVTSKHTSRHYVRIGYALLPVCQSVDRLTAQDCLFVGLAGGELNGSWYVTGRVRLTHRWRAIWRLHTKLEALDAGRLRATELRGLRAKPPLMTDAEYRALIELLESGDEYALRLWAIFVNALNLVQMPIYSPGGSVQRRFYQAAVMRAPRGTEHRAYRALLRPGVVARAMLELARLGKERCSERERGVA